MSGIYAHNKLFDTFCRSGADNLPDLEDDVQAEFSIETPLFEEYAIAIEDFWPDFVSDFEI